VTIRFYTPNDDYGCFSNFSRHGVELDGVYWPTAEHCFQAMKFSDEEHRERIRQASTPGEAKRLGRDRSVSIRADWDDVRDEIMLRIVRRKFEMHADLRQVLLDTGDEELVEGAPSDPYWGRGADGRGENRLGKILMQVREELGGRGGEELGGRGGEELGGRGGEELGGEGRNGRT
jgi:ribA/ribD-fused uncharacterized protein